MKKRVSLYPENTSCSRVGNEYELSTRSKSIIWMCLFMGLALILLPKNVVWHTWEKK